MLDPDARVNAGATESEDISAQNSPTVVRSPVRPAELAASSRIDTPFFSCRLHVSSDGGKSWDLTAVPAPKGEEAKCFAPDVAFSADGTLYFSFVTLKGRGNVPNATWISTSEDGGRTLSKPVKVLGKLAFQVRLAADPVNRDRVYMTWLQGRDVASLRFTGTGNPIKSIRSDDGGDSWSRPQTVSDSARERVVAPSPVVGPNGELYVLYVDMGGDTLDYSGEHRGRGGPPYRGSFDLVLARSVDKGKTWQESVVDRRVRPISRFVVFIPPFPSVAVDRDGRVYAAFQDKRLGDSDVLLWSLARGASDWRGPKRVNDTKERDGTSQYLPKLSVAPNGRLDVLYYDRRADRARNVMNQVSLQSSFDAGRTFGPSLRVSSLAFDSRIGFGAKEGLPDLGSRLGLLSDDRRALGVWTDTRAGTPATQKQDIARASVAFTSSAELSKAAERRLRYGGLALVLVGLALIGLWAWARGASWHLGRWAPL
ncbi:MAG: exo-alpha-sialidase, partial [Thermoleophilaceae bacterium]|nr:exo-alpha-sialidase [Thermoleophilaceae bacterium]